MTTPLEYVTLHSICQPTVLQLLLRMPSGIVKGLAKVTLYTLHSPYPSKQLPCQGSERDTASDFFPTPPSPSGAKFRAGFQENKNSRNIECLWTYFFNECTAWARTTSVQSKHRQCYYVSKNVLPLP